MRQIFILLIILITFSPAFSKTMLFGGAGKKEYLGCLDCNEFSSSGIFNEFAGYGNEFSSKSPWNEFSTSNEVPVLVDENGKFYGYFTINEHRRDAVKFSSTLYKIFKRSNGDLEKVRISLCNALGKSG